MKLRRRLKLKIRGEAKLRMPPSKSQRNIITCSFAVVLITLLGGLVAPEYSQGRRSSLPVEVPFEFVQNQIVVAVKIAGKGPFYMIVDTGTDSSAIDLATAKEIGLAVDSRSNPATGGPETKAVSLTRLPSVELGTITARDIVAGTIDLKKLAAKLERPIHGVLGYSFLKDRIIQIDYAASKLRFFAESPYAGLQNQPNTVNKIAMPFRYDNGVLIDSVFVNGQKLKAVLDTGSSGTFALTAEAVAILGLEDQGPAEKSVGYNGEFETRSGTLKSVRIGRLSIESMPASFWPTGAGHDKAKFQVNIGNGFFKDYLMTFDFRGKIVVFEQRDD
jgi:predicted aspartyl protease